MTDVSAVNGGLSDYSITPKQKNEPKSNELGQSAFLELMITQLNNQDPLSPQDNGEFIAQLAQFSSVEGLERLNTSFDQFSQNFLSNQALQASSLVGRSVTVPADTAVLDQGGFVSGLVDLPASTPEMNLNIYAASGTLVRTIPLGFQAAGEKAFRWDGFNLEVDGKPVDWTAGIPEDQLPEPLGPGQYKIKATASLEGESTQLETALSANVNSVTVGAGGGLTLNLAGLGAVSLDQVKQFN